MSRKPVGFYGKERTRSAKLTIHDEHFIEFITDTSTVENNDPVAPPPFPDPIPEDINDPVNASPSPNPDHDDSSSNSEVDSDSASDVSSIGSSLSEDDYFEPDNDEGDDEVLRVETAVREWAIAHNITNLATSDLLRRLRNSHPNCFASLHIDARTILHTPSEKVGLTPVPPGHYYNIGFKTHLSYVLSLLPITVTTLFMVFCFDGFSVAESNFSETWPILVCFPTFDILKNVVFPLGIYAGCEKPADLNGYLRAFFDELKELLEHGYTYKGRLITINPTLGICCDTPARNFITGTKHHGGFSCCAWCKVVGFTFKGRRVYLETTSPPRTDAEFRMRDDPEYRPPDKSTPLEEIGEIDFVKSLILDPMHLLFKGVMKTLVSTWLNGLLPHKFSVAQRTDFLNDVKNYKAHIPTFFKRKSEAIKMSKKKDKISIKWKAKEYRLFWFR
ncbi:unnamed protein product [Bemisia tabaci]|uniref:Transposase domain-containing protein n=1 Tax=Bemisia tabaci TaxID=7038 RepID=A0A9P0A3J8_BEMTA|nr:unnamed protein product [Bemisia tabaci]